MPTYTPVPTVAANDWIDEIFINTYWRDNMAAGVPDMFSAKGQLAVGSAADVMGVLNVGTDGYVLTAASAEALGMKWSNINPKKTRLRKSVDQNLPSSSSAAITWDVEDQDDEGLHDNITNNTRITFAQGGLYRIEGSFFTTLSVSVVEFKKNGVSLSFVRPYLTGGTFDIVHSVETSFIAGDYIEVWMTTISSGVVCYSNKSRLIATRTGS